MRGRTGGAALRARRATGPGLGPNRRKNPGGKEVKVEVIRKGKLFKWNGPLLAAVLYVILARAESNDASVGGPKGAHAEGDQI